MDPTPASPCTCFRLRRASRQLSQMYDSHLAPVGLSLNAYSILRRAPRPRQLGELANALGMDRTTLSRNLKPLLAAGWLQEQRGPDARQRLIVITARGSALLRRARPLWQRAQDQVEAAFGAMPTQRLNALLDQLDHALPTGDAA
ncbi:MarR family protein [compost metagenome]